MTVKEAIEYIISKSKDDESLLTDTKRFWAFLLDLAPEHRKELNVIKRSLDSDFLNLCFKDKEDIKRRVLKMKFRLEDQGLDKNWIDFIIDSFFTPLGWMPPKDEEETSQAQNQQTQKQQTQKQQIQSQQRQNQQTQYQQTQNQQIQSQQTQKQQTQKQQRQNQQIQKQQTQKQQTQNQQTQKQQTQNQQTQKQQTQKQQIQKNQQINPSTGSKKQKIAGYIVIILVVLFVLSIIISNSNNNYNQTNNNYNQREKIETKEISLANVGDYIKFGNYPQTAEGEEKPIEWLVLSKENNKMFVISRYGLDAKRFDSSSNVWLNSEIRKWLNGDFYNQAFTDQEKKSINLSNLSDVGTSDNVFLLSREEAEKYFSNDAERKCKATEYAVKNGAYGYYNGYSWWLRSPNHSDSLSVCNVHGVGFIHYLNVSNTTHLVRPALWINLYKESTTISTSEITNNNYNQREKIETKEISLANVGDYIKFGNYPQTTEGEEKPIEWQVLSKENNKMLVISRYGLDAKRFDSSSNIWLKSEIRKWLNGEFYNQAFTDQEKKSINLSNLSDVGTGDNVFLLSKEEAEKYFANADERRCRATEYAVKNGAYVDNDNSCWWWLRSSRPINSSLLVYCVRFDGNIGYYRVFDDYCVVRPALWINL